MGELSKEEISKINKILDELSTHEYAYIFAEPVDHEGLGLTDYLTIVKKPMDLSTVRVSLNLMNRKTYKRMHIVM